MTQDRFALIIAQSAMLNAEIAMATAENTYRTSRGETVAYGGAEIYTIIQSYEPVLGYNAVLSAVREGQ